MPETLHLEKFSPEAKSLVANAQGLADKEHHERVEPIHLLIKLLEHNGVQEVLKRANVNPDQVSSFANAAFSRINRKSGSGLAYLSSAMLELLDRATKDAKDGTVSVEHLLNATSQEIRSSVRQVLEAFDIGPGSLRPHMSAFKNDPAVIQMMNTSTTFSQDLIAKARAGAFGVVIGRDTEVRRLLQILSRHNKNNPLLVGQPGCGKTAIIHAIAQRLANNEVPQNLVRTPFVELDLGSMVSGAKLRSEVEDRFKQTINDVKSKAPDAIFLIENIDACFNQGSLFNISDFIKNLLQRGDLRLLATTTPEGLRKINEKDASFVRQFTSLTIEPSTPEQAIEILRGISSRFEKHHNVSISDVAITSAVNLAKRYVQDRSLPDSAVDLMDEASARKRVEITGIPSEMDRRIRRLSSLQVQRAQLETNITPEGTDPNIAKTLNQITREISELEPSVEQFQHKFKLRRQVFSSRIRLNQEIEKLQTDMTDARASGNFGRVGEIEYDLLPKAQERLKEVENIIDREGFAETSNMIGAEDVAQIVQDWTGIPLSKMLENETEKLVKMEDRLKMRVVGQDPAIKSLSKAIRRARVGLRDPKKPIGSFLFLGPSGVGKTEISKAVAEFLFDDEQAMVRLDMSEFMEKHNAARLIGPPPGYQGAEAGGELINAVRAKPYSVILFDEVEKAHPDVFNLLLQVLDDGKLTSGTGELADFSNCLVIMTSNIGSKRILETDPSVFDTEEGREAMSEVLRDEVKNFLRPEFINRIDDTVIFKSLTKENLTNIVDIELRKVEKLVAHRDLKLKLTDNAKKVLVENSWEPSFGARPLKREIIKRIQDPLADTMLKSGYKFGSVINVDVEDEQEFVFSV